MYCRLSNACMHSYSYSLLVVCVPIILLWPLQILKFPLLIAGLQIKILTDSCVTSKSTTLFCEVKLQRSHDQDFTDYQAPQWGFWFSSGSSVKNVPRQTKRLSLYMCALRRVCTKEAYIRIHVCKHRKAHRKCSLSFDCISCLFSLK